MKNKQKIILEEIKKENPKLDVRFNYEENILTVEDKELNLGCNLRIPNLDTFPIAYSDEIFPDIKGAGIRLAKTIKNSFIKSYKEKANHIRDTRS